MTNQVFNRDEKIGLHSVDDVWDLALMFGIQEEEMILIIDEFDSYDDKYDDKVNDRLVEIMAAKLVEMGYDNEIIYDNIY